MHLSLELVCIADVMATFEISSEFHLKYLFFSNAQRA